MSRALYGCADDLKCDSGQSSNGGFCQAVAPDAGVKADSSTPNEANDASETCGNMDFPDGLGHPCTTTEQCKCGADFCAVQPTKDEGVCTYTGCKEDANLCPSGWSCFDLSMFDATQPSICTQL